MPGSRLESGAPGYRRDAGIRPLQGGPQERIDGSRAGALAFKASTASPPVQDRRLRRGKPMPRVRAILFCLVLLVSFIARAEPAHGHHCIFEEAACGYCRVIAAPAGTPPVVYDVARLIQVQVFEPALCAAHRRPEPPSIVHAPLRGPPGKLSAV